MTRRIRLCNPTLILLFIICTKVLMYLLHYIYVYKSKLGYEFIINKPLTHNQTKVFGFNWFASCSNAMQRINIFCCPYLMWWKHTWKTLTDSLSENDAVWTTHTSEVDKIMPTTFISAPLLLSNLGWWDTTCCLKWSHRIKETVCKKEDIYCQVHQCED